jgi:hypothetical protein
MSSNVVYYHLPDDDQFSLDFVNPDRDVIDDRLQNYEETTETRIRSYDLDETVYVIYTKTNVVTEAENIEYSFEEAFAEMDADTRVLSRYFLDVFTGVQEQKFDEEGVPLDAYKNVEIERVPDALEHVDWSGTIPEGGGQLASNLILCHALPNTNHRTSFSVFEGYVNAASRPLFALPSLATEDYEWQSWVDDYIVDSKRLLTVRRNVGPFRYLFQHGCDTIRRKGEIDVPLDEYDLDVYSSEALRKYAGQHEQLIETFAETILKRTDRESLVSEPGIEKVEFADYVRQKP